MTALSARAPHGEEKRTDRIVCPTLRVARCREKCALKLVLPVGHSDTQMAAFVEAVK